LIIKINKPLFLGVQFCSISQNKLIQINKQIKPTSKLLTNQGNRGGQKGLSINYEH